MDKVTDKLNAIIQEASLDGTLSKRAIDLFHGILKENEDFKTQLEANVDKIKADALMIDGLKIDLDIAKGLNKVAMEAEMAMIEREKHMTTLELTAKHHEQRVVDHQFMFTQVFRNLEMRRNVFVAPVPGAPDQYGNRGADSFPTEHQQTEKTE